MRPTLFLSRTLVLCTLVIGCTAAFADEDKTVYGWVENARLIPWGVEVKSKLDTGALTSSLHATDIEEFERDDKKWVRFTTRVEDERNDDMVSREFERPLYRQLKVTGAGGSDHRPVVLLKICMNHTIYEEQFSLRDRGDMNYPLLLGRRTIKHLGLIDVNKTFLRDPECTVDSDVIENESHEGDDA
ncbi:retropepsin-like aspartic peptidase RloA3 [Salinisphaera aquimarina]|uniref:ATP-dependent zinc protease n=1 Tax=Salinisphaera aquimarina TaxID=2094031 RepID=A0ABV7EWD4_9GAMM